MKHLRNSIPSFLFVMSGFWRYIFFRNGINAVGIAGLIRFIKQSGHNLVWLPDSDNAPTKGNDILGVIIIGSHAKYLRVFPMNTTLRIPLNSNALLICFED